MIAEGQRFQIEALEPRILLSGDSLCPGPLAASSLGPESEASEVRITAELGVQDAPAASALGQLEALFGAMLQEGEALIAEEPCGPNQVEDKEGAEGESRNGAILDSVRESESLGHDGDVEVSALAANRESPQQSVRNLEATSYDGHADKAGELVQANVAANSPPNEDTFEYQIQSIFPSYLTLTISQIDGSDYLLLLDENYTVRASQELAFTSEVRILGSDQDDKLTLDFSTSSSVPIFYDGGDQTSETGDILEIIGDGTTHGSYLPHPTDSDKGIIIIGDSVITFTGLEPVTQSNLASFTFTTPGSADVITIDSPAAGQNRISGTSDGVAFESLTFFGIQNFIIDTGANDGASPNDSITFTSDLVATGLQTFTITTGSGTDTIAGDAQIDAVAQSFAVTGTGTTNLNGSIRP